MINPTIAPKSLRGNNMTDREEFENVLDMELKTLQKWSKINARIKKLESGRNEIVTELAKIDTRKDELRCRIVHGQSVEDTPE